MDAFDVIKNTGNKKLENLAQLATEYGYFMKMAAVTVVILIAGYILRNRSTPSSQ